MNPTLEGQVAWITGGGSGIGLAGARALAEAGAQVVIAGRNPATLAEALAQLQAAGRVESQLLDVADPAAVDEAARALVARHGRLDILINSAGTNTARRGLDVLTPAAWDEVVGINLHGLFYAVHAALPTMRAQGGGLIVNVSSWAGLYATRLTGAAYNASKRAVLALTETLNLEEGVHGIRATALVPGEVATPILDKRPFPPSAAQRARMVQPEDVGQTLRFLAGLPPRVCINELVISPTHNRFYVGDWETG